MQKSEFNMVQKNIYKKITDYLFFKSTDSASQNFPDVAKRPRKMSASAHIFHLSHKILFGLEKKPS